MVQPHHHHHDGTKSTDEPSYNIFRDSLRKFNALRFVKHSQHYIHLRCVKKHV